MTKTEASEFYNISVELLDEYESWGLCGEVKKVMGAWQYDDRDIERLSMIMTLHDIGFSNNDIETYMRLMLEGDSTEQERLRMLSAAGPPGLSSVQDEKERKVIAIKKDLERIDALYLMPAFLHMTWYCMSLGKAFKGID